MAAETALPLRDSLPQNTVVVTDEEVRQDAYECLVDIARDHYWEIATTLAETSGSLSNQRERLKEKLKHVEGVLESLGQELSP